jgi:lysozyme
VTGVASAQAIDVSNFQGNFGWATAKRQVPNLVLGMFRLTEGLPQSGDNSPDPFAAWNHAQIRDAQLYRGAYHFLHPSLSGKAQAQYFLQEYGKLGFHSTATDIFALDTEATDGLSAGAIAACARDFMAEIKASRPNNPALVYSNFNFANIGADSGLGVYPLWLAFPSTVAPRPPAPWNTWTFWQWGTRPAAGEIVDADAFNGTVSDFENWIARFHNINPVHGLRVTKRGYTGVDIAWDAQPGATSYTAKALSGSHISRVVRTTATSCRLGFLLPRHTYTVRVRAHPGHSEGVDATVTVKLK